MKKGTKSGVTPMPRRSSVRSTSLKMPVKVETPKLEPIIEEPPKPVPPVIKKPVPTIEKPVL